MKRTPYLALIRHLRILMANEPKNPRNVKAILEELDKEAEERGFARRDSIENVMLMDKKFHRPAKVDGFSVANLPSEPKCGKEFDTYRENTEDFISKAVPYKPLSTSNLGGGFGSREDKQLGFLRPRNPPPTPLEDDEAVPFGEDVDQTKDSHLARKQSAKRRMEYMKSLYGSTMSQQQHFLLADLDFEKDGVLLGDTLEEFERNVGLLKNVILTYTRWERTDNIYYYATLLLKALTVWTAVECLHQYYELHQLAGSLASFLAVSGAEVERLAEARRGDMAAAARQLRQDRPDFGPLVAAIRAEKRRVEAAETRARQGPAQGASAASEVAPFAEGPPRGGRFPWLGAVWHGRFGAGRSESEPLRREDFARYSYAANPGTLETLRAIRRILLPRSEDYTQIVREEMLQYKRDKEKNISLR